MKRLLAFPFTSRCRGAAALEEVQKLRDLCAALYVVCDCLDARADVLSVLSKAAVGDYTGDPTLLLPYPPSEAWLFKNKEALASVKRGLEQAQRGEFADPPDLDDDKRLAAMIPDDLEEDEVNRAMAVLGLNEKNNLPTEDGFVTTVNDLAKRTHRSKAEVLRDAVNLYHKAVIEWGENNKGVVFQPLNVEFNNSNDTKNTL
jgi:predicted transcriptional regulator